MLRDGADRNDGDDDDDDGNNDNTLHFKCTSISALHHPFNPRALGRLHYFL